MSGWAIAADIAKDVGFASAQMAQSKRSQRRAFKHGERMYRNRYQWAKEDLKAAGYNPMLAYMSPQPAAGAGPAPTTSGGSSASITKSILEGKMLDNIEADVNLKNSARRAKEQERLESVAREITEGTKQRLNSAQAEKLRAELPIRELVSEPAKLMLKMPKKARKLGGSLQKRIGKKRSFLTKEQRKELLIRKVKKGKVKRKKIFIP